MLTSFTVIKPRSANYTPASLIYDWAKANRITSTRSRFGELLLSLPHLAKYDHWKITDNGDGTETVTVYLVAV